MRPKTLLFLLSIICTLSCTKTETFKQPKNLQCEYQVNPLGIDDIQPGLSWYVNDTNRGAVQTAYHILVATDPGLLKKNIGDIWDSKKVVSGQSSHVVYQGSPLQSRKRYYWKVMTWDKEGNPSAWSEPDWWEMALLNRDDWTAKWIGMNMIVEESVLKKYGNWISYPGNSSGKKPVYFRKCFTIPEEKTPREAFLTVFGENHGSISVNGNFIGKAEFSDESNFFDVSKILKTGKNLVAFSLTGTDDKISKLVFSLEIIYSDGTDEWISSDENCKVTDTQITGWNQPEYDDTDWDNARINASFGLKDLKWLKTSRPAPRSTLLRKEFTASGKIKKARAYVSGLGNYKLYINGYRISDDLLTPGWTHYPERIQYQIYDITKMITRGENAAGMILGNMWWSSGLGWAGGTQYSSGPLRGLCQLEIEYTDGSIDIIVTDETWKSHLSPVVENTLYHGETYDARLELDGWSEPGLNEEEWSDVTVFYDQDSIILSAQFGPPIRVTNEIRPVGVFEVDTGKYVFDMGINMVGFARLKVEGSKGTEVTLRFAELLHNDSTVAQENLRSAKSTDRYILKGTGKETWQPMFTYHGFRYVEMEGFPGVPTVDNLTGLQFHSDAALTGKFECSNELLNKIWKNILNGQKSNMHSIPTDCPQRDERLGWTGDAQMFAPTANYNMNMASFFSKWVRDMTDSQSEEGWIFDVNPVIVVGGPGKPAWGDAITIVPWMVYKFYGDKKILENSFESMKAWVEYMRRESEENIYVFNQDGFEGYGDWVAVVESPGAPIASAYYYYSTKLLSQTAKVLGKSADAATYDSLAKSIADAFNKKYLDTKTLNYTKGTQTANLLPLVFGIVPEEFKQKVADNIAVDVISRDKHLSTGFLGTGYLLPVLSNFGYHDLAYEVAIQITYPSWGYMVEKGATSIWELWNSDTEPPDEMNSRNHFALGSVVEWYYAYLAGIRPDPDIPGFKHSIIAPMPPKGLAWAEGKTETVYGPLWCKWQKDNNKFKIEFFIPPNTSATVKLPSLGLESPTIKENGRILYAEGLTGDLPDELKLVGTEKGTIIFEAGSGRYTFEIE